MSEEEELNETTMVRLVNLGPGTFRKQYAGRWYEITPGEERWIPYFAACMFFGNPKAANLAGGKDQDQHRRNEVRRLSAYWGTYGDPWYVPVEESGRTTSDPDNLRPYVDQRHPGLPVFELYDHKDNRIITVIDDPEGDNIHAGRATRAEARDAAQQLEVLSKNYAEVLEILREIDPQKAARMTGGVAPAAPAAQIILPDADQTVDVVDDGFDEKEVADVPATEDLPPAQRPAAKKQVSS